MKIKDFIYTKADGKVSQRHAMVISEPSNFCFCIDLTEFDTKDREFYEAELLAMDEWFKGRIQEMGLGQNYRRFNPDKMS